MTIHYALTILVSAFLLFQVQPLIARVILPWFGGTAAVWTVCLLFFQLVLLLGYLYSHALVKLRPRTQALAHAGLLAVSLAVLPILPGDSWKPSGHEDPTLLILALLSATIGLPYFLLSTTGPLVQSWYAFSGSSPQGPTVPYRLYALSNAGSMGALLTYPVLFEPNLTTRQQGIYWSLGYATFVLLCGAAAWRAGSSMKAAPAEAAEAEDAARPSAEIQFFWLALPACATALLLSISNHMTQNVAAIPFLWVLPLSLYLLTFILTFDGEGWYRRNPFLQLFAVAAGSIAYALSSDFQHAELRAMLPIFSIGFFILCMVCHGELVRLKPHPRYLTKFYLMLSLGGAIGGAFVGLFAPHAFKGPYELPVALTLSTVLVLMALARDPESGFKPGWTNPLFLVGLGVCVGMEAYLIREYRSMAEDAIVMDRNFYGPLKVLEFDGAKLGKLKRLINGTINHGEQYVESKWRYEPVTYYAPATGVGYAIKAAQEKPAIRVGVVGLGTGTIAAYGRAGDVYKFYEINPLVTDLARHQFTYLGDSKAKIEVALGDARLTMEKEAPQDFDVLAVDAFSSDSIPVHLLTREAMAIYFRHLKTDGILAIHVSNRYLDLPPVVRKLAQSMGKTARMFDGDDDEETGMFGATWVLVPALRSRFDHPLLKNAGVIDARSDLRLWTDDYSNLAQIIK